jgi:hypothetical protein
VRNGLFDFGIRKLFDDIFCVAMKTEKVVELPESEYPEFAYIDRRMVSSAAKSARFLYLIFFSSAYGRCALKPTRPVKGPQLAQAYIKGLDETA